MKAPENSSAATSALKALSARGEAFLRMFEETEEAHTTLQTKLAVSPAESLEKTEACSSGSETESQMGKGNDQNVAEQVLEARRHSGGRAVSSSSRPSPGSSQKAKRLFMSGKAARVHDTPASQKQNSRTSSGREVGLTSEEFKAMRWEVDAYGISGLKKKEQKLHQAARLEKLNARPEKQQRMPANIGKGIAAKRKEREQKALQEAIETGMVQSKGMGKRKRRQRERARKAEPGLMEDGGAYRNGVLKLKHLKGRNIKRKTV